MKKINNTLAALVLAVSPIAMHAVADTKSSTPRQSLESSLLSEHTQKGVRCWEQFQTPRLSLKEQANYLTCADNELSEVLKANPNDLDALFAKSELLHYFADTRNEIQVLNQYLKIKKDERVLEGLGYAHTRLGEFSKAQTFVDELFSLHKDSPVAYQLAGWIAAKQNKHDEALSLFRQSLTFDPKNNKVMNNMAFRYLKKGDPEKAVHFLKKAVEINPDHWNTYSVLGDAYMQMNQIEPALTSYKMAEELRPGGYKSKVERAQALLKR